MKSREAFVESFRLAQLNFSQLYALLLTQEKLNPQDFALLNLLTRKEKLMMTEASAHLHISKPAVTNLVDRLSERRLMMRKAHPHDRRSYLLEIQPKGKRVVEKIQSIVFTFLFETLDRFNSDKKETIQKFYDELAVTMGKSLTRSKGRRS